MMRQTIRLIFVFILLTTASGGQAQNSQDSLFAQEPEWMAVLTTPAVNGMNYYDLTQRFESYKKSLPNGGKKTPYNKHVLNFFKRWQKRIQPFVCEDGTIVLPQSDTYQTALNRLNKRTRSLRQSPQTQSGQANWRVVAPLITYDYKTKKTVPWQSNIQRFDVASTDENILYCGSETGMLFKTTDQGKNWHACAPMHYFGGEVSTVEISKSNADKVIAGAGMTLWLTEDGGDTWSNITPKNVKPFQLIRDAVFDPQDDTRIILGSDEGVYVSEDNGKTWQQKLSGRCFDIKFQRGANASRVYLLLDDLRDSDGANIYLSQDRGNHFTKQAIPDTHISSGRFGVSEANPDYVYLLACQGWSTQHPFFRGEPFLFKSTDAGNSWNTQAISSQLNSMDQSGGQGYYDMVMAVSHTDPEHILFGILFLYSSHDGGKTLDLYPQNSTGRPEVMGPEIGGYYGKFDLHTDMQDLYISPRTGETWLSTDGGMIYCADMMNQEPEVRNEGIYAAEFWGFDQGWNEDIIVGGRNHNGDMVRLSDYGKVSVALRGSEHSTGYVFLSNPRKITFSDTRQKLLVPDKWTEEFKDFENAEQFQVYPVEGTRFGVGFEYDPRYAQSFLIVTSPAFGLNGSRENMLWRTEDDGLSYTKVYEFENSISSYTIARSNPNKIVVASGTGLFYSTDHGNTFQEYNILPEMKNTLNYRIVIHPTDENEIWVTTHEPGGIFRTTDNGATWEKMDTGLQMPDLEGEMQYYQITRFFLTGNSKNAVYAIADVRHNVSSETFVYAGRVMYWDQEQNRWTDYSNGLPTMIRINRMLPFYKEGKIRIATNNGVWETELVDPMFTPIAQPVILNSGTGKITGKTELQFDSYSIANQNDATWEWKFRPQPVHISDPNIRNPVVTIAPDQSYDVTLTVTNALGQQDTKTISRMIEGSKDVPDGIGQTNADRDITLFPTLLEPGDALNFQIKGFTQPLKLTIYDLQGKMILQTLLKDNAPVRLPALPSGMYLYKIEQNDYLKVGRFYCQ